MRGFFLPVTTLPIQVDQESNHGKLRDFWQIATAQQRISEGFRKVVSVNETKITHHPRQWALRLRHPRVNDDTVVRHET